MRKIQKLFVVLPSVLLIGALFLPLSFVAAEGIPWGIWQTFRKPTGQVGTPYIHQYGPNQFSAFVISRNDGTLWYREQDDGANWRRIGKPESDELQEGIAVANYQDGRLAVFASGRQGVWTATRTLIGLWSPWQRIYAQPASQLSAITIEDGRIVLLALNTARRIEAVTQTTPNRENWAAPVGVTVRGDLVTTFQVQKIGRDRLQIFALAGGLEILRYSGTRLGGGGSWMKDGSIRRGGLIATHRYIAITFDHKTGTNLFALLSNTDEIHWYVSQNNPRTGLQEWLLRQTVILPTRPAGLVKNGDVSILAAKSWDDKISLIVTGHDGFTRIIQETYPRKNLGQWEIMDSVARNVSLLRLRNYYDGRVTLFGQDAGSGDLMIVSQQMTEPKLVAKIKHIRRNPGSAETVELHELQNGQMDKMTTGSQYDSLQVNADGAWVRNLKVYFNRGRYVSCYEPPPNPDSNYGTSSSLLSVPPPKSAPATYQVSELAEPCPNGKLPTKEVIIRVSGELISGEIIFSPSLKITLAR